MITIVLLVLGQCLLSLARCYNHSEGLALPIRELPRALPIWKLPLALHGEVNLDIPQYLVHYGT